jgi:hypothetical protein
MNTGTPDADETRFIVVLTWRRESRAADDTSPLWRGFAQSLEKDGSTTVPVWFRKLDDLGGIMRRLLPAYAVPVEPFTCRTLITED